MAASYGWAAVTSELLGRAGTQVTVVVAPRVPSDPRRTRPEPVLRVLGRSRSAAPSTDCRGPGHERGGDHDGTGERPDRPSRTGGRVPGPGGEHRPDRRQQRQPPAD